MIYRYGLCFTLFLFIVCFTVALVRANKLITARDYYNTLPGVKEKDMSIPEIPMYYFVSGFTHPQLPILKEDGVFMYEWGLIPSWVKDLSTANSIRSKTLNAKSETVFEKPSFKDCVISQRCILPVVGFYEWRDVNGIKYPYFIEPSTTDHFLLASIYNSWTDALTGEIRNTFSIMTTPANPLLEKIHNLKKRMPLILNESEALEWLEKDLMKDKIIKLIKPYPQELMLANSISRAANNHRQDRNVPEIMDKVEYFIDSGQALF